jgi:hypothetical protein
LETDDLLMPSILLMIALSITFTEPLQKIEKSIQEFPNKLFSLIVSPSFIITVFFTILLIIIFLKILKHKTSIKRKKLNIEEESIKKLPKQTIKELDLNDSWGETNFKENIKTEDSHKPEPQGKPKRNVTIKVDSDKRYFHKKNISKDETKFLLDDGYQIKKYKNLLNDKMENFLLQPRHNESFTHLFLTHNISEFLEKNGIETELYTTKKPDIVFETHGKKFAIEIETGSIFSKISRMKEKLKVLENYDKWFFVVTDRNKVKKYKKYGNTVDKRYVKIRLEKLIKSVKKPQK